MEGGEVVYFIGFRKVGGRLCKHLTGTQAHPEKHYTKYVPNYRVIQHINRSIPHVVCTYMGLGFRLHICPQLYF